MKKLILTCLFLLISCLDSFAIAYTEVPIGHVFDTKNWTRVVNSMAINDCHCDITITPDVLEYVNRSINHQITYKSDLMNWGVPDYWATPAETAKKGSGDCEDIAFVKMNTLLDLGLPKDQISLVLVRDVKTEENHAVLNVKLDGKTYVLDNVVDDVKIAIWNNYVPLVSFIDDKTFIYGVKK